MTIDGIAAMTAARVIAQSQMRRQRGNSSIV
jgi:hypothetical protein